MDRRTSKAKSAVMQVRYRPRIERDRTKYRRKVKYKGKFE